MILIMGFTVFHMARRLLTLSILLFLTSLLLNGCAGMGAPTAKIQRGDEVMVDYTCRLPDGALLITTDGQKAEISGEDEKAKVFMPLKEYGPVSVTAGDKALKHILGRHVAEFLDLALPAYIAEAVVGLPYDKRVTIELEGQIPPNIAPDERFTRVRRSQRLPLTFEMKHAVASREYDKEIVPGDTFDFVPLPGVKIRFDAVNGPMVTAVLLFEEGHVVPAPWGRKHLNKIDDQFYRVVTQIEVDELGRAGGLIGRIESVEKDHFRIDWGDPFGGRTLSCDVFVHPIQSTK
jgi:FKBP-type peptidyl-prolyl cis-trans isomerase 2